MLSLKINFIYVVAGVLFLAGLTSTMVSAADNYYETRNNIIFYDRNEPQACTGETGRGITGGTVDKTFSLGSGAETRQVNLIKALMNDYGLTPEQAAGPVGNFMWESGGVDLPPDVNEGNTPGPPAFSGGYGWAQWTGSRQVTFIDFAIEQGLMASKDEHATDAANYAYLKNELEDGYTSTITELKKQDNTDDATESFEATYERADPRYVNMDERQKNAKKALAAYKKQSGDTGFSGYSGSGVSSDDCTGNDGGVGIVGNVAFPLKGTKKVVKNPEMFRDGDADLGGHPYTAYDILADPGTEVVAFMSGKVVSVSEDRCPGRLIVVHNKEQGIAVSYMHLSFTGHIGMGETVQPGDKIGAVGPAANGCGIAHLHIDAVKGSYRPGCSRLSCSEDVKKLFVKIGPQLYETYQKLPD